MSKSSKQAGSGRGRQRQISVRGVRRDQPDLKKLSRALIALALEQAAAEAAAQAQARGAAENTPPTGGPDDPA